ncbi:MAG TPA: acetoin utilization protein AcuC [Azospirillaceae bacterium]|nr:acetoin utilization protein AcuC [Azospirillaceae bacterium]
MDIAALAGRLADRGTLFIGSDIYRHSRYGRKHPLAIPRVGTVIDICRAMGWLPDAAYADSPRATPRQLARFHDPAYIALVQKAEADQHLSPDERDRANIGKIENPIYPEVFRRPATAAGGSILAGAVLASAPRGIVYSPGGGTHHGRPDRASGFCFFNDPVLGILAMLDHGAERILYVDLDAHHGDGVEAAFHDDDRVFTISIHEEGRWPRTGAATDRAGGAARNLPVPPDFNDSELDHVLEAAVLPLGRAHQPDIVVVQGGCDALHDDPMSRLALSNRALWYAVRRLVRLAPRALVLGGGGYNPWAVGRCWSGIWATLNGLDPDVAPTPAAQAVLRDIVWHHRYGHNPPDHWFTTLADPPRRGPVRDEVKRVVEAVLAP